MSTVSYNVDDYTISELLAILGLDEDATEDEVMDTTNKYIQQYSSSQGGASYSKQLAPFFESMQTKLLQYMNSEEGEDEGDEGDEGEDTRQSGRVPAFGYKPNEKQTEDWFKYQALPQKNAVQKDKNTERIQKIDVYDNDHVPMNREQLGVNNTFNVPVAQDTLNPNLENITSRFINLDSQFRQASGGTESISTDYTLDLSDPLTNVLSLRLYSIQIPYTWYSIDYVYGNTCFWVTNPIPSTNDDLTTYKISLEPGNYSPSEFCTAVNQAFIVSGFTYPSSPYPNIATFNSNNGKITLLLNGWLDPTGTLVKTTTQYTDTFDSTTDAYFTFFDLNGLKSCYESGTNSCATASSAQGRTFNGTLGWLMGFRLPIQPIFTGGNTPISVLNLYGTKYFILLLDDYNQNHINNGLITITELSKNLPLPSYYNTSQPYFCMTDAVTSLPAVLDTTTIGNLSNISPETAAALGVNPNNFFNSLQDKLDFGTGKVQQILPSAPRTLTQAQIYTINEIIKTRNKTISFRAKAPTNSDTFSLIPIKYGSMTTGQLYTEVSGQFQDNKRIYFGPVNIDRLRITLLDDRGNTVDLHGADWCVTLISENLYQY